MSGIAAADEEGEKNPILSIKLSQELIAPGIKIAREEEATPRQLAAARRRLGFPLKGLLTQGFTHNNGRAKILYMEPPNEEWFDFGYSKLVKTDSRTSLVLAKDGVIIQIAATGGNIERSLIRSLNPEPVHLHKISSQTLPEQWSLINERILKREDLSDLGKALASQVISAVSQVFLTNRKEIFIKYYACTSDEAAEMIAGKLADGGSAISVRTVLTNGEMIAVGESQDENLNRRTLSFINW